VKLEQKQESELPNWVRLDHHSITEAPTGEHRPAPCADQSYASAPVERDHLGGARRGSSLRRAHRLPGTRPGRPLLFFDLYSRGLRPRGIPCSWVNPTHTNWTDPDLDRFKFKLKFKFNPPPTQRSSRSMVLARSALATSRSCVNC